MFNFLFGKGKQANKPGALPVQEEGPFQAGFTPKPVQIDFGLGADAVDPLALDSFNPVSFQTANPSAQQNMADMEFNPTQTQMVGLPVSVMDPDYLPADGEAPMMADHYTAMPMPNLDQLPVTDFTQASASPPSMADMFGDDLGFGSMPPPSESLFTQTPVQSSSALVPEAGPQPEQVDWARHTAVQQEGMGHDLFLAGMADVLTDISPQPQTLRPTPNIAPTEVTEPVSWDLIADVKATLPTEPDEKFSWSSQGQTVTFGANPTPANTPVVMNWNVTPPTANPSAEVSSGVANQHLFLDHLSSVDTSVFSPPPVRQSDVEAYLADLQQNPPGATPLAPIQAEEADKLLEAALPSLPQQPESALPDGLLNPTLDMFALDDDDVPTMPIPDFDPGLAHQDSASSPMTPVGMSNLDLFPPEADDMLPPVGLVDLPPLPDLTPVNPMVPPSEQGMAWVLPPAFEANPVELIQPPVHAMQPPPVVESNVLEPAQVAALPTPDTQDFATGNLFDADALNARHVKDTALLGEHCIHLVEQQGQFYLVTQRQDQWHVLKPLQGFGVKAQSGIQLLLEGYAGGKEVYTVAIADWKAILNADSQGVTLHTEMA
jgi:hypothetical protein